MRLSSIFLVGVLPLFAAAQDRTYTSDRAFKDAVLNATNEYREWFNATAVTWNETLVDAAEDAITDCIFEHSGQPYGENLAAGFENVTAAVRAWLNEVQVYDFGNPDYSTETGHFTQLVWKNTTQIGCARKECGGQGEAPGWFIACEYYPPGNYLGQFGDQVDEQVAGPDLGNAGSKAEAAGKLLSAIITIQILMMLA